MRSPDRRTRTARITYGTGSTRETRRGFSLGIAAVAGFAANVFWTIFASSRVRSGNNNYSVISVVLCGRILRGRWRAVGRVRRVQTTINGFKRLKGSPRPPTFASPPPPPGYLHVFLRCTNAERDYSGWGGGDVGDLSRRLHPSR